MSECKKTFGCAVGINSTTAQPLKLAYHFKVESLSGLVIAPNIEIPLDDPNSLDEFLIDTLKGINSKKQLKNPPDSFKFHDEYGNPMNFTNLTTEKTITVRVVAIFWTFAKRSAMIDIKEGIFSLRLAGWELRADREVSLAAARKDWSEYKYASDLLWADIDFVRQAFKHYPFILRWASRECVLTIVSEEGNALAYAAEDVQSDKDVVIAALMGGSIGLREVHHSLQDDKDVVLAAVKKDGKQLEFARLRFRSDKEVVLAAVRVNGLALEFAECVLRNDVEVVLAAVNQNTEVCWKLTGLSHCAIRTPDDFWAVRQCGLMLAFTDYKLVINNKKLVLEAVSQNGLALKYARGLERDKQVALAAVRQNGMALQFVRYADKKVVLEAIEQNGMALEFAPENLRADKEIVRLAVNKNSDALAFASAQLQIDGDLLLLANPGWISS